MEDANELKIKRNAFALDAYLLMALARRNLREGGADTAQVHSLATSKLVHGSLRDDEGALSGVVDNKNVDALAIVGELPAGSALR